MERLKKIDKRKLFGIPLLILLFCWLAPKFSANVVDYGNGTFAWDLGFDIDHDIARAGADCRDCDNRFVLRTEWLDVGTVIGNTSGTYNGSITNGSLVGYAAANNICDTEHDGSHFCTATEVMLTIAFGDYAYSGTDWIQNGPPGYTANADDCSGWTNSSNTFLGPFWNWEYNNYGGVARLTNCAQTKSLLCCK